jgi:hypothetical protein
MGVQIFQTIEAFAFNSIVFRVAAGILDDAIFLGWLGLAGNCTKPQ